MAQSLVLDKRWITPQTVDQEKVEQLRADTNLPLIVCRLLVQRGITDIDSARDFLAPKLSQLHDPSSMKGVDTLVDRLLAAKKAGRKVAIHGDYDVDGITSTTLLTQVLDDLGFEVVPFVPHRMIDGYGVSTRALDLFKEQGVETVLTCDTGFSAVEEIRYGREELGLEILVTDHHTPPEVLPEADAMVNPHQDGCAYPFKELCGAGVAFKVLQALVRKMGLDEQEVLWRYLDLVALGTVCDVVPLRGENRILAKWGIRAARQSQSLGLRTLFDVVSVPLGKVDEGTFGWIIGPRLNAAGRIDDADKALEVMTATDPQKAERIAREIDELNTDRRAQTQQILESANQMIAEGPDLDELYGIVLFDDGTLEHEWHHGVIGIVASKVVENYGRAAFLFAKDEKSGKWKGSGRAPAKVGSVNLYDALSECAEHLDKFGGHAAAAGATLNARNREELEAFAHAFNEAMKKQMRPEERTPTLYADLEVRIDDLTQELWSMLRRFSPFGHGNEPVKMIARGATVVSARAIGKDKTHLKLKVRHGDQVMDALGWGFMERYPEAARLPKGAKVDLFFKLDENTFRGKFELQLIMDDLRITDPGDPQAVAASRTPATASQAEGAQGYNGPGADGRHAPKNLFS